ncbi:putative entry exclusion protein TrbK-alt [Sphingobium sp. BS19]|uniref:putative entry exclusion protein TrbK-alt n=1 Tax=Sphingobium sp. BS19 TaxID=3018973 RepID=UPI002491FCE6|nr:putative entry exclusion protein TrbK-alt [Sphingobium sp. BS19]
MFATAVAGFIMAVTLVMAMLPDQERSQPDIDQTATPAPPKGDTGHCRTTTVPDAECGATWEERRQRFFGGEAAS